MWLFEKCVHQSEIADIVYNYIENGQFILFADDIAIMAPVYDDSKDLMVMKWKI